MSVAACPCCRLLRLAVSAWASVETITPAAAGEPVVARPTREAIVARVACDPVADDVARALLLSQGTIRNHLAALTHKLGARSRADAYRIARDNGSI